MKQKIQLTASLSFHNRVSTFEMFLNGDRVCMIFELPSVSRCMSLGNKRVLALMVMTGFINGKVVSPLPRVTIIVRSFFWSIHSDDEKLPETQKKIRYFNNLAEFYLVQQ